MSAPPWRVVGGLVVVVLLAADVDFTVGEVGADVAVVGVVVPAAGDDARRAGGAVDEEVGVAVGRGAQRERRDLAEVRAEPARVALGVGVLGAGHVGVAGELVAVV